MNRRGVTMLVTGPRHARAAVLARQACITRGPAHARQAGSGVAGRISRGRAIRTACAPFREPVALLALVLALVGGLAAAQPSVRELPEARRAIDATGFRGVILVYDPADDRYIAGHAERAHQRYIPASTFKIMNALIALETGVVRDASTVIEWDGVERTRTALNRDLDLRTAFRISALPHFQELARRIGPERMQRWIDAVGYGNRDLSGGIDRFWLDGGLRISPREQVDLLTRLVRGDLPFSQRSRAIVTELMVDERTDDLVVRGKTGWAQPAAGGNVGWWVGWVEGPAGVHVFATVLEAEKAGAEFGPARKDVTRRVLEHLGAR